MAAGHPGASSQPGSKTPAGPVTSALQRRKDLPEFAEEAAEEGVEETKADDETVPPEVDTAVAATLVAIRQSITDNCFAEKVWSSSSPDLLVDSSEGIRS